MLDKSLKLFSSTYLLIFPDTPNPRFNDESPHPRFNDAFPVWLCPIIAPGVWGFMTSLKKFQNLSKIECYTLSPASNSVEMAGVAGVGSAAWCDAPSLGMQRRRTEAHEESAVGASDGCYKCIA